MEHIIGIDLGATNVRVAYMRYIDQSPSVIENVFGATETPSVVAYKKGGQITVLIGEQAKNQAFVNPKSTFYDLKRLLGKQYDRVKDLVGRMPYEIVNDFSRGGAAAVKINGRIESPQAIISEIIMALKKDAEKHLNAKVAKAVITVPAYFNDTERQAIKDAGQIAGLEISRIINDPIAACLAYGLENSRKGLFAIYDLGGSTFNITIVEAIDGLFEVKATNGDMNLGGEMISEAMVTYLMDQIHNAGNIDLRNDLETSAYLAALQRIWVEVEKAKKLLSTTSEYEINLPYLAMKSGMPFNFSFTFKRSKLEEIALEFINKTIEPCKKVMLDAGIKTMDLADVILVGGASQMACVAPVVERIFGKKPSATIHPAKVVVFGAAIQGGILSGSFKGPLFLDE